MAWARRPHTGKPVETIADGSGPAGADLDDPGRGEQRRRPPAALVAAAAAAGAVVGGALGAVITAGNAASASAILRALGGFAWPLSAILILWLFREPLSQLIGKIRSAEVGPQGVKLALEDIMEHAGRAVGDEATQVLESYAGGENAGTNLAILATTDPVAAVNHAWRRVRSSVKDLCARANVTTGDHGTPQRLQSLINAGVVNPDLQVTVQKLRSLYYDIKQRPNVTPTPSEAASYVAAAQVIESELNSLLPRLLPSQKVGVKGTSDR